jgi:hypothetical protein
MTAPLEISPEAAACLGPDALARASDPQAVPPYTCPVCDLGGSLADAASPAALIVWHYLPARTIRIIYAHAACSPSAFLTINASPPPGSGIARRAETRAA